ncbi:MULTISPECIES: exonuclease domain-containing protein [unclassified Clostridioides]|uniref:exonuclease domain-containing protein n=1 Tax=unclassified Clostridioides TaxID=2635829 RepID=UPI001D123BD1|nr:3'-5' exoribonuclease [Clostridioides sp. ES-S-0171-01]MCC0687333.1 3'-5' exoribonuclease [Clostridioides sp. ES-S-0056-01]MCC0714335.1 3'-5' exoribonuclease [Clostridioides sp. ES-S-0077-01]UDN56209.1 3'-5' exoribonuclease [Clostridioides sp. ES-S-0054-01]
MLIVHLSTGARKGVILTLSNAKMNIPKNVLHTAITKGFNKAMDTNLTKNEVMTKHFVNIYDRIKFYNNNNFFNLEYSMSEYSLEHKTENYIFLEENLSIAEIDSKNHTRILSIDFETANSKRCSVCSIGFVVEEDNEILIEKEILVNPNSDFSKTNIKIHGITPEDVSNSPKWDEAWSIVEEYITPSTLVIAHNLRSMELACIRQECERYNMEMPKFAEKFNKMSYDTLKLAKDLLPDLENYKLSTLAKKYNIEFNHHNSLEDAKTCLKIFKKLQNSDTFIKESNNDTLLNSIDFDFEANCKDYPLDWALKNRKYFPSFENVFLFLSNNDYNWDSQKNLIKIFGEDYNMKITFIDIRKNIVEIENLRTNKTLKPIENKTLEFIIKEIRKRFSQKVTC